MPHCNECFLKPVMTLQCVHRDDAYAALDKFNLALHLSYVLYCPHESQ